MKQLILILLSVTFFTACDNEPLDADVINNNQNNNGNGNNNGNNNNPLALNQYRLDINSTVPLFGNFLVDTDFNFNANNRVNSATVTSTFFGSTSTENVTFSRNNSAQITGFTSVSSGVTTNETTVTYNNDGNISEIEYNYIPDNEDDYTYNFVYNTNTITRTEMGSNISTVFTLNNNNLLVRKESFDGDNPILLEILAYDGNGNCISSVISGEDNITSNFTFDTNTNPLKAAFSDQYYLSFLNDDYSDEVGTSLAQFASTNNWIGISTPEGTVNFTLNYDNNNRITTRTGSYDLGDGVLIELNETFQFVN